MGEESREKRVYTVLCIDDETMLRRSMADYLEDSGFRSLQAENGRVGLDIFRQEKPDIILVDLRMPEVDGLEVLASVHKESPETPIIVVSGTGVLRDSIEALRLGAWDYLIKPIEDMAVLEHAVNRALERARFIRENREYREHLEELVEQRTKELVRSEERYRTVATYTYDFEGWIGPDGEMLYVSPSVERVTGYGPEIFENGFAAMESLIDPQDLESWREFMRNGRDQEQVFDYRVMHRTLGQRWVAQVNVRVNDEQGRPLGIRFNIRDITKRKELEGELRYRAMHDPLTGLSNRIMCQERLRQAVERARRREGYSFAVVFMDIDRFQVINDSMGHHFGDEVLKEVARRIKAGTRALDVVCRFGGDEFVILMEELESQRESVRAIKRIREAVSAPMHLQGRDLTLTSSMGILLCPPNLGPPEEILQCANIAMHRAKGEGTNKFKVFTSSMLSEAVQVLSLENELRQALANDELFLVFQPIIHLPERRLAGFEALVRWRHPEKGIVSPGVFIPVAEESGLIVDMGQWILEKATGILAGWQREMPGMEGLTLSVNVSGKQFATNGFFPRVQRILADTEVRPEGLKLEITETAVMENAATAVERLHNLRSLGVTLSIDDFGTGYSSMSYLQRFPLDSLKVDLSFVRMLTVAPENVEIVKAIVSLAHALGLEVVAEGIETEEQERILAGLGCELGQGYLYAKPLPLEEAEALIRTVGEGGDPFAG